MKPTRLLLLLLSLSLGTSAHGREGPRGIRPDGIWRTLETKVLDHDTLTVRASWQATAEAANESTFVEYRIEDADQRLWATDSIPSDWCDLSVSTTDWRSGAVVELQAWCDPCAPGSDCTLRQFVYLVDQHTVARSEWTRVEWDPADGDFGTVTWEESCVVGELPVLAEIRDARIEFELSAPLRAARGEPFPVSAWLKCYRSAQDPPLAPEVILYSSAGGLGSEIVRIDLERFTVASAIIRLPESPDLWSSPEVLRIEVDADGKRGFLLPGALESAGFYWP